MYDVDDKLLSVIKNMYVDSLVYQSKRGVREQFRVDSRVRQGCIMFSWLFNVYIGTVMKEVKMGMGRRGFLEERRL